MKKIGLSLLLSIVFLLFTGCSSIPPMDFSVKNVNVSQHKINAEVKSITASVDCNYVLIGDGGALAVPQLWQTALTEAINKMAIFQDDATRKVNISVKIIRLDIPTSGISFTTESGVIYEITDRKTGEIIFSQYICSHGSVPFSYNALAVIRARESVNRAAINNIQQFLQVLKTVNVK